MWLLPANAAGDRTVRLPLTDRAAHRVSATLLIEDAERRNEQWRALLAEEPPLLLWALGSASEFRDAPPRSLRQVANWCDSVGLTAFTRVEREVSESGSADADAIRRRRADIAARGACREAAPTNWETSDAASAWCAARIVDIQIWLNAEDARVAFAPGWLLRAFVARTPNVVENPAKANDASERCCENVRRSWLEDADDRVDLLAPLARRLLMTRELTEDFQRQLLAAKLASLKELAYGASHEINNPLANIATRAQSLLADERDVERRRKLATIAAQAYRAHEMISDLMLFARPPALRRQPTDLGALVDQVLGEFAEQARTQRVTLVRTGADESPRGSVDVDPTQMAVAVQALVRNAFESLDGPGRVEVELEELAGDVAEARRPRVRITVRDDGPGVSPRALPHLFDPFFSGREAGRGLGFGLSKCWRIVTEHGGEVRHEPTAARGATFVIELPCDDKRPETNE